MIKAEEIRNMTPDEIDAKIEDMKKEHFNLRVQAKTGKLDKADKIKKVKRDIARLKTIKRQNELKAAK